MEEDKRRGKTFAGGSEEDSGLYSTEGWLGVALVLSLAAGCKRGPPFLNSKPCLTHPSALRLIGAKEPAGQPPYPFFLPF